LTFTPRYNVGMPTYTTTRNSNCQNSTIHSRKISTAHSLSVFICIITHYLLTYCALTNAIIATRDKISINCGEKQESDYVVNEAYLMSISPAGFSHDDQM